MANDRRSQDNNGVIERVVGAPVSRRRFLTGAGAAGVAAVSPLASSRAVRAATPDGTPEQIHLTWGEDPSRSVVVSWAWRRRP